MGYSYLNSRKYFIEWDDKEIRFLLPDTKSIETLQIDEIKSVGIKLFEIELELKNGLKRLILKTCNLKI